VSQASAVTDIDDDEVRITTWIFDTAGDATGQHVHEFDYVVVPVTGGRFTVAEPGGATRDMTQEAASPYRGVAGTAHNVISATESRVVFVEIELKR
jgi:hypothetical protein